MGAQKDSERGCWWLPGDVVTGLSIYCLIVLVIVFGVYYFFFKKTEEPPQNHTAPVPGLTDHYRNPTPDVPLVH